MKKDKKNHQKRISALKRNTKRSTRLKSTQQNKANRKKEVIEYKKKAQKKFEQHMKSLLGK